MSEPTDNNILLEERDGRVSPVVPCPLTDRELITIATVFRAGILEGQPSSSFCFMVCAPLQSFLSVAHGIETKLINGSVNTCDHWWLELPDGRIIDPTADQFGQCGGRPLPAVYLGPLPNWYEEER